MIILDCLYAVEWLELSLRTVIAPSSPFKNKIRDLLHSLGRDILTFRHRQTKISHLVTICGGELHGRGSCVCGRVRVCLVQMCLCYLSGTEIPHMTAVLLSPKTGAGRQTEL